MFCGGVIAGHGSAGLIAAVAFVSVMFSPISAVGHPMLEFLCGALGLKTFNAPALNALGG